MSVTAAIVLVDSERLAYAEVREDGDVFVIASAMLPEGSRTLRPVREHLATCPYSVVWTEELETDALIQGRGAQTLYRPE